MTIIIQGTILMILLAFTAGYMLSNLKNQNKKEKEMK